MEFRRRSTALLGLVVLLGLLGTAASASAEPEPFGTLTEFATGIDPISEPFEITKGPDGNLWFTERAAGQPIGRITPTGEVTEFSTGITAGSDPFGIAAGPDGNLWFTELLGNRVGRITPTGEVTEFSTGITAASFPGGITSGPDGNLWFTEFLGNRVGRITPTGEVTEFSTGITVGSEPFEIAAGPDGNLWFTELNGNRIGRITPAGKVTQFSTGITVGSSPRGIAAGPDGNLWFTELLGDRIARITPTGKVTQFSNGIALESAPFGITAAPDGNIWFTQEAAGHIARFTLGPETALPLPTVTKVAPNLGPAVGGTTVTITGALLSGATAVKFGPTKAVSFTAVSATSMTAVSPAGAGVVDVTVTTASGTSPSTVADRFSYMPTIKKVTPSIGSEFGGTTVSITGTNFTGATEVSFGSNAATKVTVKSATSITAVSPAGEEGPVDVAVTTPGGTSPVTPAAQFTYVPPPTVTSVSPNAGPKAGGTPVTITGTEFALGTTGTIFVFGTAKATLVNCISTTECTVVAPAHAVGKVDVKATVNKITSLANKPADQYTYS